MRLLGLHNVNCATTMSEGTDSSPVGYLEAVFVKENFRNLGLAANWSKPANLGPRKRIAWNLQAIAKSTTVSANRFTELWDLPRSIVSSVLPRSSDKNKGELLFRSSPLEVFEKTIG